MAQIALNTIRSPFREDGGRIPPQAVEVEEAVLGAMLIEREAATIALQLLRPEDFYKPANKHIFETLFELYERDNPLDLLTVENELRDKNLLDVVGGTGYLADLTRSVSSAANIDYHSQIIAEKSIKRNLILHCNEIIKLHTIPLPTPRMCLTRPNSEFLISPTTKPDPTSQSSAIF